MATAPVPSQPGRLLRDYSAVGRRRHAASVSNTAVRLRSRGGRALVANDAMEGLGGIPELERLSGGASLASVGVTNADLSPARVAAFARTIALQRLEPDDVDIAIGLYGFIERTWGTDRLPPIHQSLHAQLMWERGDLDELSRLLRHYRRLDEHSRVALELNLAHPVHGRERTWDRWLAHLSEWMPPATWSLIDVTGPAMFDRVNATAPARKSTESVTVALTCFRPGRDLMTAVRSLVAQSWKSLEILLIDDASGAEYDGLLREATELDDRITLVRLEANGGTYVARNRALDLASGSLLTFQDSDDWSHPDRIALQVEALNSVPGSVATVADGIKMGPGLTIDRTGRPVTGVSMPSTMIRLDEVKNRIGYFHTLRKSADGEYLARMEAAFGEGSVVRDPRLLQLLRQGDGSLSRSDFGAAGAVHPAREAYRSAYGLWHKEIASGKAAPFVAPDAPPPVPTHAYLHHNSPPEPEPVEYDYVFATDWRPFGAPAKSSLEEITALLSTGATVGVLQLDTYRYASTPVRPLCDPVQDFINRGLIDRLLPNTPARTRTLFVRYPPVLQFDLAVPPQLSAEHIVVIANQAPQERDGSDVRYSSAICSANAEAWFGAPPVWVPQGAETRRALEQEGELRSDQVSNLMLPSVVEASRWAMPRSRFRTDLPVLGRHSRDHYLKWPDTAASLLRAYPAAPSFDVRVLGGADVPRKLLGGSLPTNWTAYDYDEVDVKTFLYQVDFWVYFHHPVLVESFGRAILEAMATGCVVILPHRFTDTFGDGAIYCEIDEVQQRVESLWKDFDAYREQSERGMRYVRTHFDHAGHIDRVRALTENGPQIPKQRCDTIATSTFPTS